MICKVAGARELRPRHVVEHGVVAVIDSQTVRSDLLGRGDGSVGLLSERIFIFCDRGVELDLIATSQKILRLEGTGILIAIPCSFVVWRRILPHLVEGITAGMICHAEDVMGPQLVGPDRQRLLDLLDRLVKPGNVKAAIRSSVQGAVEMRRAKCGPRARVTGSELGRALRRAFHVVEQ